MNDASKLFAVALVDGVLWTWGYLDVFTLAYPPSPAPSSQVPSSSDPPLLGFIDLPSLDSDLALSAICVNFSGVFATTPLWSHVSCGKSYINLVAQNGTIIRIGRTGAVYQLQSVEQILASYSPGSSSGLVQVASSESTVQFLFSDGSMFTIIDDLKNKGRILALATVPDSWDLNVPVKADFGLAIPSNYKVVRITPKIGGVASGGVGVAVPKSRLDATIAPLITSPQPTDRPVALWNFGVGYTRAIYPYSSAAFYDMRLYPEHNSFAKYAFTASHVLFLTTNGSLMVCGNKNLGSTKGVSPLETELDWTSLHPLPQWLFGGLAIIDIAVGTDDSLALASNGSIFAWGQVTSTRATKREDTSASSDLPEDLSFSQALRYDPTTPSNPFTKVWASGSQFAAIDSSGLLFTWGTNWTSSETEFYTPISHSNLLAEYGSVVNFTFAGPNYFYVLTSSVALGSHLILGSSAITPPSAGAIIDVHAWYSIVDPTNQSPLSPTDIAQLDGATDFCLILSRSGKLYGVGTHELWFNNGNTPGTYAFPQLVTIGGLTSVTARKIAQVQQLYVLDHQGRLFASNGDLLTTIGTEPAVQQILSGHKVLDIFSWSDTTVGSGSLLTAITPYFAAGGLRIAIVEPSPDFIAQPNWDYEPHYMTVSLGANQLRSAINGPVLDGLDGKARLMPVGHPLERDTTKFTNDTGSAWMFTDGLYPDGSPRKICSHFGIISLFQQTMKPSYFPRLADNQPAQLIHTHAGYTTFFLFYDNCTIVQIQPDKLGANFISSPTQFSSFESGFDSAYEAGIGTQAYQEMYSLDYNFLTSYEPPQCALKGKAIANVACHSLADGYPSISNTLFDASHWCVQQAVDGSMFVYGLWHLPTINACDSGTLGEPAECTSSALPDELYYLTRFSTRLNTTGTIFAEEMLTTNNPGAQFSLGPRHALLTTPDGRVFGWGTNVLGQLSFAPTLGTTFPRLTELTANLAASPGAIPSVQNANPLLRHENGSSNIRAVLVSYRTSFAILAGNTDIYAWGDNRYGLLGRGPENPATFDLFSSNAARVNLPVNRPFRDFQCATTTCYVLYDDGTVYSWGSNGLNALARPISASARASSLGSSSPDVDPTPLPISTLSFPGRERKIVEIKSSPSAGRLVLRAILVDQSAQPSSTSPTTPSPENLKCRGNPPTPNAICVDGTWISNGDVTVGRPSPSAPNSPSSPSTPYSRPTITIPSTTVILGNLTVGSDALIIAVLPLDFSTNKPLLNVTGCVFIEGELQIVIDPATWEQLKKKLDGKSALLIESSCGISVANLATTVVKPDDCRQVKAKTSTSKLASGNIALSSVFIVDGKKCTQWAIILGSVLGAVVVISAVIAVACSIRKGAQSSEAAHRLKRSTTG